MSYPRPERTRNGHSHTRVVVHFVWATARRAPLIAPESDGWLRAVLERKAGELGCRVLACGNASDHVHVVLPLPPTICIAEIARGLKGTSSHAWNAARAADTRAFSWQAGYWAESVTPSAIESLLRYVTDQRAHHAHRSTPGPWEADLPALDPSPS